MAVQHVSALTGHSAMIMHAEKENRKFIEHFFQVVAVGHFHRRRHRMHMMC